MYVYNSLDVHYVVSILTSLFCVRCQDLRYRVVSSRYGRRFVFNIGGVEGMTNGATFGNFICQTVNFGEYLCDNWSTKWANFAVLNTDAESFLNQFFSYLALVTKSYECKVSFYYY